MARRGVLAGLLAASAVILADTVLWAAEDKGEGGLPQFDVTSFPSQIFWLVVAYAVLFYLMSRKALPRVAEILEARQDRIARALDQAARLREEADELLKRHQARIAAAQQQAQKLLRESQERLQEESARRQAELERELTARLREAEARIAAARKQALERLDEAAAEAVQAAVLRLAGIRLSKRDALAAVRQAGEARVEA